MCRCDLHIHTTASDGKFPPEKVVKFAKDAGLTHMAITDHDTVEGIEEGMRKAQSMGIELIPGVEFSANFQGKDIHILGYFIEYTDPEVKKFFKILKEKRELRAKEMVDRLNFLGYEIDFERVREIANKGAIGRVHIAKALYEKGYTPTHEAAFYGLIGDGDPAYVPKFIVKVEEAIEFLRDHGAVVVLAHPGLIGDRSMAVELLESFNFDGVEVYHPKHSPQDIEFYRIYAERKDLIITGGSDFHWFTSEIRIGVMDFECTQTIRRLYLLGQTRRRKDVEQTR